jgi:large subunit ribosomal protein L28
LDRAPDYGSGGLRFDSLQRHSDELSTILGDKNSLDQKVQGLKFKLVKTFDTLNFLNLYIMSKVCQLTGKRPIVGNNVSHSNRKTKRRFLPNLQKKRFFIPETDQWVTLKVCTSAMRTISKLGIYEYLQRLEKEGVNTGVSLEQGC